jgi:hypothetical protein
MTELRFGDRRDFEDADRGFIAKLDPGVVTSRDGQVVWDSDSYAFLSGDCPDTANPSLWRQGQLCARQGLYAVTDGVYQVRGLDLSNVTLVEGEQGVIVIDPLISAETAAAALGLYRGHRGDRPVTAVIYTHSHVDHFGGVQGVVAEEVPILAPVGLVAIGASGALAELLGRLFGPVFVAGDLPGVTYTAQRCAEYLEYFPDAGSCAQAAALHHWGEVVEYRVAVGVLGLLVLGGFLLWRRRPDGPQEGYVGVLPDGFSATVATSLYGVAAAALALLSLDAFLVAGGDRTGQWLSAAIVASAMAAVYGVSLYRTVLTRARLGAATVPLDQAGRPSS